MTSVSYRPEVIILRSLPSCRRLFYSILFQGDLVVINWLLFKDVVKFPFGMLVLGSPGPEREFRKLNINLNISKKP